MLSSARFSVGSFEQFGLSKNRASIQFIDRMGLLLLLFLLPSRHYGMSVGSIDAEYVIGHTYSVIQGKRDPLPEDSAGREGESALATSLQLTPFTS